MSWKQAGVGSSNWRKRWIWRFAKRWVRNREGHGQITREPRNDGWCKATKRRHACFSLPPLAAGLREADLLLPSRAISATCVRRRGATFQTVLRVDPTTNQGMCSYRMASAPACRAAANGCEASTHTHTHTHTPTQPPTHKLLFERLLLALRGAVHVAREVVCFQQPRALQGGGAQAAERAGLREEAGGSTRAFYKGGARSARRGNSLHGRAAPRQALPSNEPGPLEMAACCCRAAAGAQLAACSAPRASLRT